MGFIFPNPKIANSRLPLHTPSELEGIKACVRVQAAVARDVLVGIPERAVVACVYGNAGVVAPSAQARILRPAAREHDVDGFHGPPRVVGTRPV